MSPKNEQLASRLDEYGGYLATKHLLEQGYRDVYAITAMPVTSTQERLNGFQRAVQEWGIGNTDSFIRSSTLHVHEVGYTLTRELIEERQKANKNQPFGILALDEPVARACYTAVKEVGLTCRKMLQSSATTTLPPGSSIRHLVPSARSRTGWEAPQRRFCTRCWKCRKPTAKRSFSCLNSSFEPVAAPRLQRCALSLWKQFPVLLAQQQLLFKPAFNFAGTYHETH